MSHSNPTGELNRSIRVWLLLVALTVVYWVLSMPGVSGLVTQTAGLLIGVAFLKIWLVIRNFMEVRHGPLPLRRLFDGWCVIVGATLIFLFIR